MSKPAGLAFQPAPRPSARVTPEQAEELASSTAGLGFSRPSTAPPAAPGPSAITTTTKKPEPATRPSEALSMSSLKFDVPSDLWTTLKINAAQRRVTVRYLVLEALSKHGYDIDLEAIPEDGRRQR